jgi:hypothetical protein
MMSKLGNSFKKPYKVLNSEICDTMQKVRATRYTLIKKTRSKERENKKNIFDR